MAIQIPKAHALGCVDDAAPRQVALPRTGPRAICQTQIRCGRAPMRDSTRRKAGHPMKLCIRPSPRACIRDPASLAPVLSSHSTRAPIGRFSEIAIVAPNRPIQRRRFAPPTAGLRAAYCAIRLLTSFRTSATGNGRSAGKRMVPLLVSYRSTSSLWACIG